MEKILLEIMLAAASLNLTVSTDSPFPKQGVWSICDEDTCKCGNSLHNVVECSEDDLLIQPCYCMYYDESQNMSLVGNCMYTCFYVHMGNKANYHYPTKHYSVDNASSFNHEICDPSISYRETFREGRFCGRCKKGYGLAAYSYHYTRCIDCSDHGVKNWLRYFAVALLPLTLFYFLVVIFRINVTTSHLNGVVFVIQCIGSSLQLRIIEGYFSTLTPVRYTASIHGLIPAVSTFVSVLGVVNLDFFRMVYPYFCLHSSMNILHVVSLDFIIATYPFALIILTYILVTLYDDNYRIVVFAWKPFKWCLRHYHRQFNIRSSLVEAFATFILLSNVKVLGVCFDLLATTTVYNIQGEQMARQYHYYDANIEYFGPEHLPFAVLALLMGFVFVLLPFFLLILYPCCCFQRCLNFFGCRCRLLHVFMDAFQGSYKTEPWDLRYFSAYYIALRFLILLMMEYYASVFHVPVLSFVLVISAIIFAAFQPYKKVSHNRFDIVSILLLALFYMGYTADIIASYLDLHLLTTAQIMFTGSAVAITFYYLLMLLPFKTLKGLVTKLLLKCRQRNKSEIDNPIEEFDRNIGIRPNHYTPLLQSSSSK